MRMKVMWTAMLGAALVVFLVAVFGASQNQGATGGPVGGATTGSDGSAFTVERRVADDVTALGAVDAPVVIVEFADYRCSYCALFDRTTLPVLVEEYVDAGLVRFEWRDMPLFGDESGAAAIAARAAGEQGLFWEYHRAVFAKAPERGRAALPMNVLVELAREVGVPDIQRFIVDADSARLAGLVQADLDLGTMLGVSSTPTFFVNGVPLVGAQPIDAFRQAIDAELDAAAPESTVN